MKKHITIQRLVLLPLLVLTTQLHARQDIAGKSISFSLFADTVLSVDHEKNTTAKVNQLELGLETALHKSVKLSAALAYNNDNGSMELGAAAVEWTIKTKKSEVVFTLGQIDMPFGITSGWYGSPDNALINTPLVNQTGINGWNNVAAMFTLQAGLFELKLYASDGSMEQITNSDNGLAAGGRAGIKIGDHFSTGISAARNYHAADGIIYSYAAADLTFSPGPFTLSFEAVNSSTDTFLHNSDTGWMSQLELHGKQMINLPLNLIFRGGIFSSADSGDLYRFSTGITAEIGKFMRAGFVFEHNKGGSDSLALQVLSTF